MFTEIIPQVNRSSVQCDFSLQPEVFQMQCLTLGSAFICFSDPEVADLLQFSIFYSLFNFSLWGTDSNTFSSFLLNTFCLTLITLMLHNVHLPCSLFIFQTSHMKYEWHQASVRDDVYLKTALVYGSRLLLPILCNPHWCLGGIKTNQHFVMTETFQGTLSVSYHACQMHTDIHKTHLSSQQNRSGAIDGTVKLLGGRDFVQRPENYFCFSADGVHVWKASVTLSKVRSRLGLKLSGPVPCCLLTMIHSRRLVVFCIGTLVTTKHSAH